MSSYEYINRLRQRERGVESPLSTKELRDRFVRPRLQDFGNDDTAEDVARERRKKEEEPKKQDNEQKKKRKSVTNLKVASSPPNENFRMSSPASEMEEMPSPQYSRIESEQTPPVVSAVVQLKKIRHSMNNDTASTTDGSVTDRGSLTESDDDASKKVGSSGGRQRKRTDPHQTPKRQASRPIQRSLSRRNTDWLTEDDHGRADSSKPSFLSNCFTILVLASVIFGAVSLTVPLFFGGFGNLLFVQHLPSFNQSVSKEQFIKDFNLIRKENFPAQSSRTWSVIGSSVKRLFSRNLTMPACILLVGDSNDGQVTANCLASKLADSVHKSVLGYAAHSSLDPLDSASLKDLEADEAKRRLFQNLDSRLKTDHAFTLLNVDQLSGQVAMTLHAFCDEGSMSASFPYSALFMTIQNKNLGGVFSTSESRADALLNDAWKPDLGVDKVSSLISRVAVSVADVSFEPTSSQLCTSQ